MIRNNVVALCIHGVIGTVIFLVGEVYWQALSVPRVAVGLLAVYAAYFFAAFAAAKLRLFNRHKKKVRHVLLPGVLMLCCIALLIMTDFSFYSEFFGLVVGVYGQPAELLLAVSGERLTSPLSLAAAALMCAAPVVLLWLGLRAGGGTKVDDLPKA